MKWVTRPHIRVNRTATAWLVRRFIDPEATFLFVAPDQVADARGRCSFEALVEERCAGDAALGALARIVRSADFADEVDRAPEAPGLRAISQGFPTVARDDHEIVERAGFLYDALYAALTARR